MRTVVVLVLAIAVGGGVAFLLLRRGQPAESPAPTVPDPSEEELKNNRYVLRKTSKLVVRARAPDGRVPPGTEVGYEHRGERRLLYAGEDGARRFTDAPIGDVVVVATAPGFEEARQPRTLLAGVPTEVPLTLRPKSE